MTVLTPGNLFHFIFLVDRSGSMSCEGRMKAAIDALTLFIRSLPTGCRFSVHSFGSDFSWLERENNQNVLEYNEETKDWALEQIALFDADHGGTDIATPLIQAQTMDSFPDSHKRIFLLTDGLVHNSQEVIDQARAFNDTIQVFTFGLGSGIDRNLCEKTAEAGRGTCSIVEDGAKDLNGQVIKAL